MVHSRHPGLYGLFYRPYYRSRIPQNTTFGGLQGFTRKPSTPWHDDDGNFAGIVHQERNLTYVLFEGAGHLIGQQQPGPVCIRYIVNFAVDSSCFQQLLVFLREFILGRNQTGLVIGTSSAIGGENSTLSNDVLPGGNLIYFGSASTAGTTTIPVATQQTWAYFIATATATATSSSVASPSNTSSTSAASGSRTVPSFSWLSCAVGMLLYLAL